MRLNHFSDKVWHRSRGQKRVSCCVALEMGHRAGVVPRIEANPMWVLKSVGREGPTSRRSRSSVVNTPA